MGSLSLSAFSSSSKVSRGELPLLPRTGVEVEEGGGNYIQMTLPPREAALPILLLRVKGRSAGPQPPGAPPTAHTWSRKRPAPLPAWCLGLPDTQRRASTRKTLRDRSPANSETQERRPGASQKGWVDGGAQRPTPATTPHPASEPRGARSRTDVGHGEPLASILGRRRGSGRNANNKMPRNLVWRRLVLWRVRALHCLSPGKRAFEISWGVRWGFLSPLKNCSR